METEFTLTQKRALAAAADPGAKDACLDPALMLLAGFAGTAMFGAWSGADDRHRHHNQRLFGRLQGRADGSTRTGR
jgi:hypothetical protein